MQVMWWIPSSRTARSCPTRRRLCVGRRPDVVAHRRGELEPERRALALDAREADPAAVRLDDLARDGQPEADARDAARPCLAAEELREDAGLVLVGDAQAVVLD